MDVVYKVICAVWHLELEWRARTAEGGVARGSHTCKNFAGRMWSGGALCEVAMNKGPQIKGLKKKPVNP